MQRKTFIIIAAAAAVLAIAAFAARGSDKGQARFFKDQAYHFQTLRALSHTPYGGADTAEVLETIKDISSGDEQKWFAAWEGTARRIEAMAERLDDSESRGLALLRAHNYYRTAEFFLPPDDPKRSDSFAHSQRSFYSGLDALGVPYEKIRVPYGDHHLNAVYYDAGPAAAGKPLIMAVGGYDSTMEELYFAVVAGALSRGYSVLTYEGPGQGAVLRQQNLPFTHEWEKPTGAVLDTFLGSHGTPPSIVLMGMSLGGYLAPRAVAYDQRIDGVVAYDVFFDVGATAPSHVPNFVMWMQENGFSIITDWIVSLKAATNPGFKWAVNNGMWTLGVDNPLEVMKTFNAYSLADSAHKIEGDVLILAGEEDHFVPVEQVRQFEEALVNARSVTSRVYDRASGGAEHCQLGAVQLWHADMFDWIAEKFPSRS